ncbi:putative lipoprotein [Staphylococcus aureus]|nr:hypothetical protein P333_01966 [Staphylococcus aureus M0760]EVP92184.1 hypothetical protein P342_02118 [Staphylococcus aureus M0771]CAC7298862.1 putative lipoprotein [Staphylococcus aureus]CAC9101459.1 putative lipoprotein [Staphylococcus aureus]
MKKFIGSVLATTLILGGCSTMENESKKTQKQKQNLYQKKWKLQNM